MKWMIPVFFLLLVGLGVAYARWIEPSLLMVRRLPVALEQNAGRALRVVFFSDTHYGNYYSEKNGQRIAETINGLEPDLVLFGGDLIDSYYQFQPDLDTLKSGLSQINAQYGKFAIWGNHDYGGGAGQVYEQIMTAGGFTLLLNETITFRDGDFSLTGLDDYLLGKPDNYIGQRIEPRGLNLLLCHAPDMVDRMDTSAFQLVMAGHTHGGQVFLPFVADKLLPQGGEHYRKGIFSLEGGAELFVSSGIGMTRIPFRLFNVPEIVSVEITY